jgi:hypothetical protein
MADENKTPEQKSGENNGNPAGKLFTQDELNTILAENKLNLQKQLAETMSELENAKKGGNTKALEGKIQELSDSLLTKEELAKKQLADAENAYKTQLETTTQQSQFWEKSFKSSLVETALSAAAAEHNAFSATQLGMLLAGQAKVVQKTDAKGNPLPEFEVKLPVNIDGKTVEVPAKEAIGKMRENPDFANLFRVKGTPGAGATLNNTPAGADPSTPPPNTDEYMAWRAKQRQAGKM